jgi:hypothetical protein
MPYEHGPERHGQPGATHPTQLTETYMNTPRKPGTRMNRRLLSLTVAATMVVAGCAAPGPDGSRSAGLGFECNPAVAAGIGAIAGGLLGGGSNTVRGAALGAGLGALACVALNYQSEQVKSAKQVQDEYKTAHRGTLPEQATLVRYDTSFSPTSVRPGQKAQTSSYIEVAPGTRDMTPKVEEELTLYKPDGTVAQTVRKPVSAANGSGAFKGGFAIPMPEGVPQGVYPIKTALYLSGKRVGGQDGKLQVVQNGDATILALSSY